jgi:tagatose 1,6-diphosphate aldolase GatY/KbaY
MSISNAKDILVEAAQGKYAVGAFNITNLVQLEAVIQTATDKRAPVIIQTSVSPAKFLNPHVLVAIYRTLAGLIPVPICLHLDHSTDIEYCKLCADAGYTNIMIDASKASFDENVRQTREVVEYVHSVGDISVEGELGTVGGVEDQIKIAEDEAALANPMQAIEFVDKTGVDIFAPAIGTAHGVYKTKTPKIDFERLLEINKLLNGTGVKTPLVVHGGTGLPEDYVKRLIECGGTKFNVSTELKRTTIDATHTYINEHREEYEPGKIDNAVNQAIRQVVGRWIDLLGSTGKA